MDESMIPCIHIEGTEVLAYIPGDASHAANDIQRRSDYDQPDDSPNMQGARTELTKLAIL